MKIRIFQPIVPEYRVALFDGLAERYGEDIEVWAASHDVNNDFSVPLNRMRYDYSHEFKSLGPFLWQKGLTIKGLSRGDVLVVCGDIHNLATIWTAFCAKLRGISVVWWGHHVSAQPREFRVRIRLSFARLLSNVFLCYTDAGIAYLLAHGFQKGRVFATGNTIDLAAVQEAMAEWTDERLGKFKIEHGISQKRVLSFCGVLREKVRVDILLHALKRLKEKRPDVHLLIIGNGDKYEEWKRLGNDLDLSDSVTWVGELRGQKKLAPWFLSSEIFAYPGRIGLSLIHAFSFGLPVVLNDNKDNHGPEYVVFNPGVNGIAFRENDAEDLAEKLDKALANEKFKSMGQNGKSYVEANYSMSRMVARYSEALECAARL